MRNLSLLSYVVPVKCKWKISQNYVAFSKYMNFTILTVHGVHNQDCIILMNNRHQPNLHDIGNVEPPSQNHHFQNSRANIAGPLHQGHYNLRLSSLFCKYRLRQHKNHGQNKLGLDSQLKNTERQSLNFQNFNKFSKYFYIGR